ncbi:MAG: hypothetical protein ACM3TN_12260 [Alphaproteobacteria bacterium]
MLTDVHYRGYRIVWDTRRRPNTVFWTGKAAVVLPADVMGVKRIHRITGDHYFLSEEDARDQLINEAKEWIDDIAAGNRDSSFAHGRECRRADL